MKRVTKGQVWIARDDRRLRIRTVVTDVVNYDSGAVHQVASCENLATGRVTNIRVDVLCSRFTLEVA